MRYKIQSMSEKENTSYQNILQKISQIDLKDLDTFSKLDNSSLLEIKENLRKDSKLQKVFILLEDFIRTLRPHMSASNLKGKDMKKLTLKKELQKLGVKVEGNYVRRSDIEQVIAGKDEDTFYFKSQIEKILLSAEGSEYLPKIQITHEGTKTKWMDVPTHVLVDLVKAYKKRLLIV